MRVEHCTIADVARSAIDLEPGRGQAMQQAARAAPSGMTSVLGLDETAVDELCRRATAFGRLWKANLLGPGNIAQAHSCDEWLDLGQLHQAVEVYLHLMRSPLEQIR